MNSVEGYSLGMRCLQCGKKLSLLRKIANDEFCSAEHRDLYRHYESQIALNRLNESQVRIARPSPAEAMAAQAAVERLRAMDSSSSDPVFVETFPIAESVRPLNLRRTATPAIGLEIGEWFGALPERPECRKSLNFAEGGSSTGLVEPGPLAVAQQPRALVLRPLFRLGVRLLASGAVRRIGQMRHAGLSSLTVPRPLTRPSHVVDIPTDSAGWLPAHAAAPGLPVCSRERRGLPCLPMEAGCSLPLQAGMNQTAMAMQPALRPLPDLDWSPLDAMREARRAAVLREIVESGTPVQEPDLCPATMQPAEPVELRTAACAARAPRACTETLEGTYSASLPGAGAALAALPRLRSCDGQEPVRLCATAALTYTVTTAEPVVADGCELLPELRHTATSQMMWDDTTQPVELRTSAGVREVRSIAVVAAVDSTDPALPNPRDLCGGRTSMPMGDRMLAMDGPTAERGQIVGRALDSRVDTRVDTRVERNLDPALPAQEAIHTTLPRMREETGLHALTLPASAASVPSYAGMMPRAMAAAASAGGPALPGFAAHPELIAGLAVTLAPELAATLASPLAAENPLGPSEPSPPAIDRQLPLAMGRAVGASPQPHGTPVERLTPVWDVSICCTPTAPAARLTIDHADGSGSRQSRSAVSRNRRNPVHSIDLRGLPGRKFWKYAPADLKWVALGLPLILVFVVYSFRGTQPKTEAGPVVASSQAVTETPASSSSSLGASLKNVLMNRAAVNLLDDFRGGLGSWEGGEGWAKTWRYGQATFLEPGNLALYKPSMTLRDYTFEFLGQIQGRSLNWVFRAKDARNYYAIRIIVTRPGPMPEAQIVQYAVIDGKEERPKVMPIPYPVRPDTMYLVRVDVRGSDFSIQLQGQPLYNFSDDRLQEGGIGFFGPKGDKSYLRWVQVKHQYDYIGRMCALLAPYHVTETAKSE